mmetsp:Transcript_15367/g.19946  ORF Transcript_15367/g.19946 Transcript_15367/m.19946 type:complete len:201 (-) Transcript_15367:258-860(-)
MGNKVSMEDELINMKLMSKQMVMASKKSEKSHAKQLKEVQKAIKQGNKEGAQIYAQNAIREKTQAMNYLRLSSRVDAVSSRLETAIRTKQISASMQGVVKGMGNALQSMDPVKISKTMEEFERQFDDMEVVTMTMEGTMDSSTASATPAEEVDALIREVADQNKLDLDSNFDTAVVPKKKVEMAQGWLHCYHVLLMIDFN